MTDYFISTINKVLERLLLSKIYTTKFASHLQKKKSGLAQRNHSILQSCEGMSGGTAQRFVVVGNTAD